MSSPLTEVLTFFDEWKPTLADMLSSMERRFTDQTIWENVGNCDVRKLDGLLCYRGLEKVTLPFQNSRIPR